MKSKTEYVRDWFEKAGNDLRIATREMAAPDPASDAVCFHFQQAAEKILKAWLIWNDCDFKPTHNIEVLLSACEKTDPSFQALRGAEALTPYSVEVRYADDFFMPTQEEMQEAHDLAQRVKTFVVEKLRNAGIDPLRKRASS
jgi:HEPN domain-containing protein